MNIGIITNVLYLYVQTVCGMGPLIIPTLEDHRTEGVLFRPYARKIITGPSLVVPLIIDAHDIFKPLNELYEKVLDCESNIEHMNSENSVVQTLKTTLKKFKAEYLILRLEVENYLYFI